MVSDTLETQMSVRLVDCDCKHLLINLHTISAAGSESSAFS